MTFMKIPSYRSEEQNDSQKSRGKKKKGGHDH